MPFTIKDWRDSPGDLTTPITAVALEDMETRLSGYTDATVATLTRVVTASVTGSYALALAGDKDVLFVLTMTGATTFSVTGLTAGAGFTIELKQDATGGRVATLPTAIKPGGTAFTLTTTASAIDILSYYSPDGTNLRAFLVGAGMS